MKALALLIGFSVGILIESLYSLGFWLAVSFVGLGALFLVLKLVRSSRIYVVAAFFLLAAALGVGRVLIVPHAFPDSFAPLLDTRAAFEGKVVADPDLRENANRLTIEVEHEGFRTKVLVVAPLYPSVRYGDRVLVEGQLVRPEPFDTDGGRVFRYDRFLAKDGIFLLLQNASLEVVALRKGFFEHVRGFFSDLKFAGIDALAVALSEPHASLASGLILGGKQGLGTELLDAFIRSGLVHIVVLSGYNVMIVAEFVMRLFGRLAKRTAAAAATLSILAFVLAAGAGAASLRAGLMAGIALYGRATGRTYDAFRALAAAGLLMLIWNPLLLAYDPGFQLSFVATLGLIFGAPVLERRLTWVKTRFMREIAAATIAAQVSVLPLLLYQNGLFSLIALPANLLVLPFVPLAMLASFGALLSGVAVPMFAPFLALPAYALLSLIITIVEHASALPLAAVSVPAFPFALVVLAYLLLALLIRHEFHLQSKSSTQTLPQPT